MKGFLLKIAIFALVAFVAAGIGNRLAWNQCKRSLATQVSGSLGIHLETLSRLRTGDPEGAIRLLETTLDNEILTRPSEDPGAARALRAAKVYRSVFPPVDEMAERVQQALETVSMPDRGMCSSALQAVWDMYHEPAEREDY